MDCRREELLIAAIARLLKGCRNVAVGMLSPIPGTAAMLARARDPRVRVLGILRGNAFTDGGVELFDLAAQGRLDAFFLGGGQIDGHGNLNLVGTGNYPRNEVRWPGSFGSAFLYAMVPRVIVRLGLPLRHGAPGDLVPRGAQPPGAGAQGRFRQRRRSRPRTQIR